MTETVQKIACRGVAQRGLPNFLSAMPMAANTATVANMRHSLAGTEAATKAPTLIAWLGAWTA